MDERPRELVKDIPGPWGRREPPPPPPREPAFNAPWPALMLAVVPLAGYGAQLLLAPRTPALSLILSRAAIEQGHWVVLLTSLFMQPSLVRALFSAVMVLALGAQAARYFGIRPLGAVGLITLYICSGLAAEFVFLALHWGDGGIAGGGTPGLGASGAISGMIGAASRLLGRPQEEGPNLAPILSTQVIGFGVAWLVVNLLTAVSGMAAGLSAAQVAIEPPLAGFVAGVLLVGLIGRVLRRT